ncbi:hypothetical protein PpBr36_06923 [Pyricularia pennisetigena]|uniref:hypothetical protein n=1 Tax=Pyricularia pennisetigena TaxID=1578925 RepID=UPI00114F107E|nr:hypothetical protein PpBr36_06923 [Pyricularia pennisetigena]TLS25104.1 hypothetical protein PpBr36_06923 [Pyricularia pennisetigena]
MAPLLQDPATNPHATLITLFMNAVDENRTEEDHIAEAKNSHSTQRLLKYLPPNRPLLGKCDPHLVKFISARDLVTSYDQYFDRFMDKFEVQKLVEVAEVEIKEHHTIIEKWPYRLKLGPGQPGAQQEFDLALASGLSTKERYMEWKRA